MILSIIIPTIRNVDNILNNLNKSIINLNYPIEVIIILDDNYSQSITQTLKNKEHSLIIHKSLKKKSGPGVCRNLGINISTGKYFTFLDDDDFIEIDSKYISTLYLSNSNLIIGNFYHNNSSYKRLIKKKRFINTINYIKELNSNNLFINHCLGISFLNKKNIFFPKTSIAEDVSFVAKNFIINYKEMIFMTNHMRYFYTMNNHSTKNIINLNIFCDLFENIKYILALNKIEKKELKIYINRINKFLLDIVQSRLIYISHFSNFILLLLKFLCRFKFKFIFSYITFYKYLYISNKNFYKYLQQHFDKDNGIIFIYCDGAIASLLSKYFRERKINIWIIDDRFKNNKYKSNFTYFINYIKKNNIKNVKIIVANLDFTTINNIKMKLSKNLVDPVIYELSHFF